MGILLVAVLWISAEFPIQCLGGGVKVSSGSGRGMGWFDLIDADGCLQTGVNFLPAGNAD